MTTQPTSAVGQLFDGGPPRRLESALRLVKSDNRNTSPGTVFISMVIWTSLVLLNVILPDLMQLLLQLRCWGAKLMIQSVRCAALVALATLLAACGQTGVRDVKVTQEKNLPKPSRILVYDFAVSERDVFEYQGIMRQQPSIKDPAERERLIAQEVKDALAEEVADGLRKLGFTVERVSRGTAATGNEMLIDGQFLTVDEGNPLRRLVIGFGSGTSTVESRAQVYQGDSARRVLEFTTLSDSGKMPGAAPMLGAGAVVQGGVTAGTVVANAAVSGVKTYKSDVARMAAASGDQVVRYLSEFFAQQGWIRADQVRKARAAY